MNWFETILVDAGLSVDLAHPLGLGISCVVLVFFAWLANFIAKRIILRTVVAIAKRTVNTWDDVLVERGVFTRMSHIAPALVIADIAPFLLEGSPTLLHAASVVTNLYLVVILVLVADALFDSLLELYERLDMSRRVPLKSFVQAIKLVVFFLGAITFIAIAFGKSPLHLLGGLGALTAVLLLVFRDSILGLVAGVQLSVNNMIRKGDWIEMPKHGADGDVVDVSLTTIKVQNWDRTITTIPTYAFISEAFRNWRGMSESGGRRIMRAVTVDLNTVRFVDDALLEKLRKVQVLREHIDKRTAEIAHYNREHDIDETAPINGRRMTNIGCFRAYCEAYLNRHPMIHKNMTFLVRQLAPTEKGLPIQIYVFVNDTRWAIYEGVQGDIFDHLLAVLPYFELAAFQIPTGRDFSRMALPSAAAPQTLQLPATQG